VKRFEQTHKEALAFRARPGFAFEGSAHR
jgi:hypothetical protein